MGRLDDLIARLGGMAKQRAHIVSHESSNLDSLTGGFTERPLGISFARAPHERMSSPLSAEPVGRRGIVYATVDGRGVDYDASQIARILDEASMSAIEEFGTADSVVPALRNAGVQWVNNWNSIGRADELHVLDPEAIRIRRVFELPKDRSYRFQRPLAPPPPARAYGIEDLSQPIVPVLR